MRPPTNSSLLEALDFWAGNSPSKKALTFLDDAGCDIDTLSYSDILRRSNALAYHLVNKLGLKKGSTCLLVYPPCLDFTVAYIACLRAGVIAVPCFPPDPKRLKKDLHMFTAIQGSSGATVALTSRSYNFATKMADIKNIFSGGSSWPELDWVVTDSLPVSADASQAQFPAPEPSDVAFLQYTSGSTSEPKGVMITHANLADNLKMIVKGLDAVDDTVVVGWLPQYHDMGLIGSVLALLFCGGSGFYMSPASFIKRPSLWVELISQHRGTHMQAPSFAYGLTARKFLSLDKQPQLDLSCVRHMTNAAEPVDTASIDRFYAVFEAHGLKRGVIFPTYGLAEHTVYVCSNGRSRLVVDRIMLETDRKVRPVENKLEMWAYGMDGAGTLGGKDDGVLTTVMVGCGRPADSEGVDLRIVDTEAGCALPEGKVGEIWVTSKSRAAGYWSQPEKTAEDFGGRLSEDTERAPHAEGMSGSNGSSAGGYLRTGDLGFLWDGELYVCGRIKDLVIVRGRNHYPQDIERTAEAAVPGVLRGGCSAAFGIAAPDGGEALAVVAEVQQVAGLDRETLAAEVRRCVASEHGASLATVRFLRPRTIPKTTSGKIARAMCKRAHLNGTLDSDTVFLWGEPATGAAAMDAIAERDVIPSSPPAGVEESKASEEGPRGDPRGMAEMDILGGIRTEVARILKADASSIPTDAPLGALGLDSMEAMQLMALLEERFTVKLPDEVMLEEDTTLATLAPIIKCGGAIPERVVAIDCGVLTELEASQGPPKDYMAQEAVEAKHARRLAESSFKTKLETGKFKPGCLSQKVKMSGKDSAIARASLCLFAILEFVTPVILIGVLALYLFPILQRGLSDGGDAKGGKKAAWMASGHVLNNIMFIVFAPVTLAFITRKVFSRFPPAGMYSRIRSCIVRHVDMRIVVDGKQEPSKPCVYVGLGLGVTEQLLFASVAPSAFSRAVRPTIPMPSTWFTFPAYEIVASLLGCFDIRNSTLALETALKQGVSACVQARGPTAAGMAPAVAQAMREGAQVIPCAVLGGDGGEGRYALAAAAAGWGFGARPGGILVICAQPVRVPFTAEPTQALVMEYAEVARATAATALEEHFAAYFGHDRSAR